LAANLIGGADGATLNKTAQDLVDKVTNTMSEAQDTRAGLKEELDNAQSILTGLQNATYVPTSSELTQTLALQLVGLGQGNATTDALLNILGFKPGSSTEAIRARWDQLANEGYRLRCQTWKKNWVASLNAYAEQLSVEEAPTEEKPSARS